MLSTFPDSFFYFTYKPLGVKHGSHDHEHDHEEVNGHYESTFWPKVAAMLVLGLCSFIFTSFPLILKLRGKNMSFKDEKERLKARANEEVMTSILMSFAGGVLFCTIFIHVLPEVQEIFEVQLKKIDAGELVLLPQVLMCVGFFMMYIIEEVTHCLMRSCNVDSKVATGNASEESTSVKHINGVHSASKTAFINELMEKIEETATKLTLEERQKIVNTIQKSVETSPTPKSTLEITGIPVRDVEIDITNPGSHHHHDHHHSHLVLDGSTAIRSFLFALALSVHELFEGLTIGLQEKPGAVWYMMFGVGAHKLVLAFCMGVEMVAGNIRPCLYLVYGLLFAVVSPAGILAGIFLSSGGEGIVAAVMQSLASGTLLYVLFFEILRRPLHISGLVSCFVVIIGFLIMFGLHFVEDF